MNQKGVTLVEVVVAAVLGCIATLAALQMLAYTNASSAAIQANSLVNEDVDTMMAAVSQALAMRQTVTPNPVLPTTSVWTPNSSTCPTTTALPACTDMTIYQSDNSMVQFTTQCVAASIAIYAQPSSRISPSLCCPSGQLPRVVIKTYPDMTLPTYSSQIFPRSGVGSALCFQQSADGLSLVVQAIGAYSAPQQGTVSVVKKQQAFAIPLPSGIVILPP